MRNALVAHDSATSPSVVGALPMSDAMRKPLVVIALREEAAGLFESSSVDVLFTGVGKVNATYRLTKALAERRATMQLPPLVVNFGTAGSSRHTRGTVLACDRFNERDMDVRGLGYELGQTPFETGPTVLQSKPRLPDLPHGTCASADCFETVSRDLHYDAIDMEAYALAKVCALEGVAFACVKYITDGADHDAASDWQRNLPLAARAFWRVYQQLTQGPGT